MDGLELARRIKGDPRIARTRLVMLGSIGRPLDPRQLRALGVLTWATKPIWRAQLLRTLATALDDGSPDESAGPESGGAARARAPSRPDAARMRVLLVEDTPINAEVISEILRTSGYSVEVAVDGLQAVDAAGRGAFDLVLMDCQLPGIDGYEAARRIRELESTGDLPGGARRVPILALTASAAVEDVERARQSGMDGHIAKPVDARRLLDAVAGHERSTRGSPQEGAGVPTHPVIDLARALDRVMGNRALLGRMVERFRDEGDSAMRRVRDRLERRDLGGVAFLAHSLRSQAMSLDALLLAEALEALEAARHRRRVGRDRSSPGQGGARTDRRPCRATAPLGSRSALCN